MVGFGLSMRVDKGVPPIKNMSEILAFPKDAKETSPMSAMQSTLFSYQAWANAAFFDKLETLDPNRHASERHQAVRLMNHAHVVSEIFAAHLVGRRHDYRSDNTDETPDLGDLRAAVAASDQWYLDYVRGVTAAQLSEKIAFTFTDGDQGYMSREEMIAHVLLHGGYHRGEVGRILMQLSIETPWDTFAVFLHRNQSDRRQQGKPGFGASAA